MSQLHKQESTRERHAGRAGQPHRTTRPPPFDRAGIRAGFLASPELAGLAPEERELVWVDELLDTMESAGWGWADLDLEVFEAVLLDGYGWTIESAPEDPVHVARVLDAFLSFAGRAHAAPHAAACCAYLQSPGALLDITRCVRPFDELAPDPLFAELSAPFNWCDGRCDRCPLAERCAIRRLDGEGLLGAGEAAWVADPEEKRAAALAAAHTVAVREALELASTERSGDGSAKAIRLRAACRDYGLAVVALRESFTARAPDLDVGELRADAMLVAVKGGRVAGYLSDLGELEDEAALMDGVPNLLLIERLVTDIDGRVDGELDRAPPECRAAYRAARDDLRSQLSPLLGCVPGRYRDEMRARVLSGCAPSPFSRAL